MTCKEEVDEVNKNHGRNRLKVLNILAPGFIAPDGGWGWVIVATSGLTSVFALALVMCFGLIFRDSFQELGINASQTTTILNINSAVSSVVGLANGPLFRKFSYRQVACVGGFVCAMSICALSFTKSFYGILIFFSILYACCKSVVLSANMLTVVTYFKKKRQIAVGLSWACLGIGSIVNPQLTTLLMSMYGIPGTVLVIGGLSLNTIACGLVLQPVRMHAKRDPEYDSIKSATKERDEDRNSVLVSGSANAPSIENVRCLDKIASLVEKRLSHRFGSQYLHYGDEENGPPREDIIPLGTSMESESDDGWFRRHSDVSDWKRKTANEICPKRHVVIPKSFEYAGDSESRKKSGCESQDKNNDHTEYLLEKDSTLTHNGVEENEQTKVAWCTRAFRAVAAFFDLDLLRDCVYLNLMFGVSFNVFNQLNFRHLIPYILSDYGLRDIETASVMSVIAGVDVLTTILTPFIVPRVRWDNRTFFLIGIGFSALSRLVLAHVSTYGMIITAAVLGGAGKALTMVFGILVIPAHVPLEKLPGAIGLEMVTEGIMFLALGPVLGWFRDMWGNYTIMLHLLNVFFYLVIISWILESWFFSQKRQRLEQVQVLCD